MAEDTTKNEDKGGKKESGAGFLIALVLGTMVALGSGWFAGSLMQSEETPTKQMAEKVETKPSEEEVSENQIDGAKATSNVELLDPIIVILKNSDNTFLRLELAIVLDEDASALSDEDKLSLKSDLSAYSRTLSLRQISGPSGYLHFRDDLLDRVRLIAESEIKDVLVLSMVAE